VPRVILSIHATSVGKEAVDTELFSKNRTVQLQSFFLPARILEICNPRLKA